MVQSENKPKKQKKKKPREVEIWQNCRAECSEHHTIKSPRVGCAPWGGGKCRFSEISQILWVLTKTFNRQVKLHNISYKMK